MAQGWGEGVTENKLKYEKVKISKGKEPKSETIIVWKCAANFSRFGGLNASALTRVLLTNVIQIVYKT